MSVKEHYDNHLGNFYSWSLGDFDNNRESFKTFCIENNIIPGGSGYAVDLGAGNGIQSIALAELGFNVRAVDFNLQLIDELKHKADKYSIEIFNDDILSVGKYSNPNPELIVCCGDTLLHLENADDINKLISDSYNILAQGGRIVLTFRDYSTALEDTDRFIPVKSDSDRILTCFLEYFEDKIRVTDLLHEFEEGKWIQKVSSYYKIRMSRQQITDLMQNAGFNICVDRMMNRMITLVGMK